MRAKLPPKQKDTGIWIIPIILISIVFVVEFLFDSFLYNNSVNSIVKIQEFFRDINVPAFIDNKTAIYNGYYNYENMKVKDSINNKYDDNDRGISNDDNNNDIEDIDNFKLGALKKPSEIESLNSKILFGLIFHIINTNAFYLCMCVIAYNFMNIFKAYVLVNTIFIGNLLSSTLAFILHSPKPFMAYSTIKQIVMFNDWGSPNTQIVILISFLLTLYKVITENQAFDNKTWPRVILIFLFSLYAIVDLILLFAAGTYSFNQLIISLIISIVTYQIIFILFEADVNKAHQLYKYIKFKMTYYLVINLLIIVFQYILYKFIIVDAEIEYYSSNINKQQEKIYYYEWLKNNFFYNEYFYLNKGNFCNVICFLMNIISFLSLKLELYFTYKGRYEIWNKHNFEVDKSLLSDKSKKKNFEYSAYTNYVYIDGTQWNHTGIIKSIIRLILLLFFIAASFIPSFFLYNLIKNNQSETKLFIILVFMPLSLITFGMFYMFKAIFRCLHLVKK